jgi:hypothetical protein
MTWRITVHHATPSPAAVRDTAASANPTCSNAHLRARSVRLARGAIAGPDLYRYGVIIGLTGG